MYKTALSIFDVCFVVHPVITCGALSAPTNGQISLTQDTVGSIAEYSCDEGFQLKGHTIQLCNMDGLWVSEAPLCVRGN